MKECPKHEVLLISQQVDTNRWEDHCPVCDHQAYRALQDRVARLWERLGMPVEDYLPAREPGSATVGKPLPWAEALMKGPER